MSAAKPSAEKLADIYSVSRWFWDTQQYKHTSGFLSILYTLTESVKKPQTENLEHDAFSSFRFLLLCRPSEDGSDVLWHHQLLLVETAVVVDNEPGTRVQKVSRVE